MLCRFLFYAVALCQAEEQAEVEAEPIVDTAAEAVVPTGEACGNFHVSGVFGINGTYDFVKYDDAGFPIYSYNAYSSEKKNYIYVYQTGKYTYWHFNYAAGEANAWLYTKYTQNCPPKETGTWYIWGESAWSTSSTVKFELL